jgi:hypothetical protein
MAATKKPSWHDPGRMRRRFARLSKAKRLELAEESERFRREAFIVEKPGKRRFPKHDIGI